MIVTLDAFSGSPNPWWELSEKDSRQLIDRVAHRALHAAHVVDSVLGYRGLVVEAGSDDQVPEGMPASFRISGPLPHDYKPPESKLAALSAPEAVRLLSQGVFQATNTRPSLVQTWALRQAGAAARRLASGPTRTWPS